MRSPILADSATTWAAMGAIATLLTALITLALGLVYSSRQTEYSRRAAANARVSADAAMAATHLAERNLALVAGQLEVVKEQTGVLQRQVDLGLLTIRAQDRPAISLGALRRERPGNGLVASLRNSGRGTAWVSRGRFVIGPDHDSLNGAMEAVAADPRGSVDVACVPGVLSVGETGQMYSLEDDFELDLPASVWIVLPVRDFRGAETWTYFFACRIEQASDLDGEGAAIGGFHAAEGRLLAVDGTVRWPVDEMGDRMD